MSIKSLLKTARGLSFLLGTVCSFVGQTHLFGQLLSSQGSMIMVNGTHGMDTTLHAAAQTGTGPAEFVAGIGFLFIGFLLHALIGVREEHERAVHITVAPAKPKRQEKWFWMEIRI
jgi:hypothetical protein